MTYEVDDIPVGDDEKNGNASVKEQFKQNFKLPNNGFSEPIDLRDVKIGFSVYKKREQEGFKSLFRIYIKNKDLEKPNQPKPLVITSTYGKDTQDGLVISSSSWKRSIRWPVDLESDGDFFYNTNTKKFFYLKREVQGLDILGKVDGWHLKTTMPFKGFLLRVKLVWFHIILASTTKILFDTVTLLRYLISGKKSHIFEEVTERGDQLRFVTPKTMEPSQQKPIEISGFKVEPWIAILYSIFHLLIYLVFYFLNYKPQWILTIFKNNFLTLIYIIASLSLANALLTELAKPFSGKLTLLLSFLQSRYLKFLSRKVKI